MADVLTITDLESAKKHDTFHSEVITGKVGGSASGAGIDYATNAVTGQIQATLPKVLRDVGFKPASFTFATGGTLAVGDADLCIHNTAGDNNWYSWGGTLPKTVTAGEDPLLNALWVPRTDNALRADLTSEGSTVSQIASLRSDLLDRVMTLRSGGRFALSDVVSVGDFDGATNADKLQAAITYASNKQPNSPVVYYPAEIGDILVSSTINVTADIEILGEGFLTNGSRLIHSPSLNGPMFNVTNSARFSGLSIIGSNVAGNTNEIMFSITNTNNVMFDRVSFFYSQTAVKFSGSAPCFYATFHQCRFENTNGSFITVDNTSPGGVDLILTETRMLGAIKGRALWFNNGLGSIIASDLQISVVGDGPIGQLVLFGTPAEYWGGGQFTNCVMESGGTSENATALYLLGTSSRPWTELHFTNTLMTGTANSPSVVFGFVKGGRFTSCTLSSSDAQGSVQFIGSSSSTGLKLTSCKLDTLGYGPCISALANTTIGLDIIAPEFTGANTFIDFTQVQKELVSLSVIGGNIGTSSVPILLNDYKNSKCYISSRGFGFAPTKELVLVGSLDGAGAANITHGITSGQSRILSVSAYYRGGSGEAMPLTIVSFDGVNISVTGGTASAKYRVIVLYSDKVDSNW